MSSDPLGGPIVLLILLCAAYAWASWADKALRELNSTTLERKAEEGDARAERLLPLAGNHRRQTAALQAAMTTCMLLSGAILALSPSAHLTAALRGLGVDLNGWATEITTLVLALALTVILMAACSAVPRRLAARDPERAALRALGPLRTLELALRPATALSAGLGRLLAHLFGLKGNEGEEVTEEDIRQMVDKSSESGEIEENEKELIENIFRFNNRTAEDVMTHRKDVAALWIDDDHDTVVKTILDTGYSRFPVYNKDMDDIVGTLNTRDYLLNSHREHPLALRALLREAYFVPETVQADALFRDMQKRKVHMAIVVDEYGGISGVVTMEDLLEEIVGNIYDEFDKQTESEIVKLEDNLWRVSGSAPLEDVAKELDIHLPPQEDYDTLGGLVFNELTAIPEDGSHPEVEAEGLRIRVELLQDHRVESALVSKLVPEEAPDEEKN